MFNGGYNPYMLGSYQNIGRLAGASSGLKGMLGRFNFGNFLSSTGKTLNVINQAIPIFYQVKPMINNAKTMFKVVGAVRGADTKANKSTTSNRQSASYNRSTTTNQRTSSTMMNTRSNVNTSTDNSYSNPTFFL